MEFLNFNKIPQIEKILKTAGVIIFAFFILLRIKTINHYGNEYMQQNYYGMFIVYRILWLLETLVFSLYIFSYIFRKPARQLATGFRETVFPFLVAALPFLLIRANILNYFFKNMKIIDPLTTLNWSGETMKITQIHVSIIPLLTAVLIMITGTSIMILSIWQLKTSFSIMAEARELVTGGIYKYIRHPLYLGEFIAYLGVLLIRLSWINITIYLLFIILQTFRAGIEEKKLSESLEGYRVYLRTTGMFFPEIRRYTR
ncbi:MAG: methyltransferase family protein [Vulcanimicrobiota bacterium]